MRARNIAFALAAAVLVVIGAAQVRGFGQPRITGYKLETEVGYTQGIRVLYHTTYRYYALRGEEKELLWQRQFGGTYQKHWTTESGLIWAYNSSGHPHEKAGLVCISKADGTVLVQRGIGFDLMVTPGAFDWDTSGPETFTKGSSRLETFTVRRENSEQTIALLYRDYASEPETLVFAQGMKDPLLQAMVSSSYDLPVSSPLNGKISRNLELWTARSRSDFRVEQGWLVTRGVDFGDGRSPEIKQSAPLAQVPSDIVPCLRGISVWFYFTDKEAKAEIRSDTGDLVHTSDLKNWGGFPTARGAEYNLHYRDLRTPMKNGWFPAEPGQNWQVVTDKILMDIYDRSGRRFLWTVQLDEKHQPVSATEQMFEGLAARRPVSGYGLEEADETNIVNSPSNDFSLRVNRYEAKNDKQRTSTRYTFLVNTTTSRGLTQGAEIWSSGGYEKIHHSLVSESGRSIVFSSGTDPDRGHLMIYEPDGRNLTRKNLTDIVGGQTNLEAVEKIDFSSIKYVQEGTPFSRPFDGFSTDVWPRETLIVKLKDGSERRIVLRTDPKSWAVTIDG